MMLAAIQWNIVNAMQNKCTKYLVGIVFVFLNKIRNLYAVLVRLFWSLEKRGVSVCEMV